MRPWVQEVSGKHVVGGLALLGFPLQLNLLHLRGFAGACGADTESEAPQSRVLSLLLRTTALLRGGQCISMETLMSFGGLAPIIPSSRPQGMLQ